MGCVICPFIMGRSPGAIRQRQESMRRWPGMWKAFEHAVRGWWDAKKDAGDLRNDHGYKDSAEYYQAYLNGFE